YRAGEAIELGRALRLPNTALRRKLELEQHDGCAWSGCGRPVQWTEAHHIRHWADGGPTVAANLILLCRFHHGRLHTPGWTITKTGPGKALIVHHEDHDNTETGQTGRATAEAGSGVGCGCPDYRTDVDLDLDFQDDAANVFPTGLYPEEWSERLKPDLNTAAEAIEDARIETELKEAKARVRARFTAPAPAPATATATATATGTVPAIATEHSAIPEAEKPSTPATGSDTGTGAGARREPELASLPALPRPQRDHR